MTPACEPNDERRSGAGGPADPADAVLAALARLRPSRRGGPHHRPEGDEPGERHAHGRRPGHRGEHGGRGPVGDGGPGPAVGPPWPGAGPGRGGGLARLRVLELLAGADDALSVGEVGERMGVDQPRASRLVQQLVTMGLAERRADPDDARRTRIALSDRGRAAASGLRGERREHATTALAGFTDAERDEFVRLLTKFAEAWPRD